MPVAHSHCFLFFMLLATTYSQAQPCTKIDSVFAFSKMPAQGANAERHETGWQNQNNYKVFIQSRGVNPPVVLSVLINGCYFTAKPYRIAQSSIEVGREKKSAERIWLHQLKNKTIWGLDLEANGKKKTTPSLSKKKEGMVVEWQCNKHSYFTSCPVVALSSLDDN